MLTTVWWALSDCAAASVVRVCSGYSDGVQELDSDATRRKCVGGIGCGNSEALSHESSPRSLVFRPFRQHIFVLLI